MTTSCTRCDTVVEHGELRCAVCALPVPVAARASMHSPQANVLRCTDCGAAVAFSAAVQAPHCGFCGAIMVVEQPIDPLEVAARRVPFSVDHDAAAASLRGWLGERGFFAPKRLHDEAVLESLTPLCWAAWVVDADAHIAWTADSDAGARRSAWAPHSGQAPMTFRQIVVPASRGLRHAECRRLVPYYDLSTSVAADRSVAEGEVPAMIESFDAQRSAARRHVQDAIERTAKVRVEPHIPGSRYRNVRVACLVDSLATDRIALPAWVLAYRYRDQPYRAIVHGQRAEVVFGDSPIDWRKVATLVLSVLGAAAVIAAIVLASGCGSNAAKPNIDAPDFGEMCMPGGTFPTLTGRAAVQGTLNVHVDSGGLVNVDTTSELLIAMDLTQTGTALSVSATVCKIEIPAVPLAGQDMPIQFVVPDATVASVGSVAGTATLASADQACADFTSDPITIVLGARLDPTMIQTVALPKANLLGTFTACAPSADTNCTLAIGTGCACDQESDGSPGATLIAHNIPAIMLDEVYVTLRTTFSLKGQVYSADLIKGEIDAGLDQGILACKLATGMPCTNADVLTVSALNPVITQQPANMSTFRSVRVPAGTACADIVTNEATLFPL